MWCAKQLAHPNALEPFQVSLCHVMTRKRAGVQVAEAASALLGVRPAADPARLAGLVPRARDVDLGSLDGEVRLSCSMLHAVPPNANVAHTHLIRAWPWSSVFVTMLCVPHQSVCTSQCCKQAFRGASEPCRVLQAVAVVQAKAEADPAFTADAAAKAGGAPAALHAWLCAAFTSAAAAPAAAPLREALNEAAAVAADVRDGLATCQATLAAAEARATELRSAAEAAAAERARLDASAAAAAGSVDRAAAVLDALAPLQPQWQAAIEAAAAAAPCVVGDALVAAAAAVYGAAVPAARRSALVDSMAAAVGAPHATCAVLNRLSTAQVAQRIPCLPAPACHLHRRASRRIDSADLSQTLCVTFCKGQCKHESFCNGQAGTVQMCFAQERQALSSLQAQTSLLHSKRHTGLQLRWTAWTLTRGWSKRCWTSLQAIAQVSSWTPMVKAPACCAGSGWRLVRSLWS